MKIPFLRQRWQLESWLRRRVVRLVTHDERVHMLGKMVVSGLRDASNRTRGGSQ